MPRERFVITFAGAVGSSKTPIAYYLSWKLNLPIFNNDSIRTEVIEERGSLVESEYLKRRDDRICQISESSLSFIYDASVDRVWKDKKALWQEELGYKVFIISLDLSKSFLENLYSAKKYNETLLRIDELIEDHDVFIDQNDCDVGLHISDRDFNDRLEMSYQSVLIWLKRAI